MKTEGMGENTNRSKKNVPQLFKVFKPISRDDFGKMGTDFLIDHIIKTHHDFAKKNAVIIYILAQKVVHRHSNTHPELLTINKIAFLFLHDLLIQIDAKEKFLFPRIRKAANDLKCDGINHNNISKYLKRKRKSLQNNHAKVFWYLNALRQITDNFDIPADGCNFYKTLFEKMKELEENLILLFHLEDNFLFPNGVQLRV